MPLRKQSPPQPPSRGELRILNRSGYRRGIRRAALARLVLRALELERARGSITIVLVRDEEIWGFNRDLHGVNAPTDILTFPGDLEGELGELLISYETAARNAAEAGWRVDQELELLAVHGILHLTGYDDRDEAAMARMWARQSEILGGPIPEI